MKLGVLFVIYCGAQTMELLPVDNWAIQYLVCVFVCYIRWYVDDLLAV